MFDPMSWLHFHKPLLWTWAVLGALLLPTSPAAAINIALNFDAAQSDSPTFDPTGVLLQSLFQEAEQVYQGVFQDAAANTTLTIDYWYQDLTNTRIGDHDLLTQTTFGSTLPSREITADIKIDTLSGTGGTERNWFIDTTPDDDEEYDMQQTLWRDLTAVQKTDLFNFDADIPDTFETGYSGNAVAESAAVGATDMLSVVLHEVGHALGMSATNNGTVAETDDNDYDFNPDFVFGKNLAAEIADGGNNAHLDSSGLFLMDPSPAPSGARRRPSHADLFAMAAGHNYTSLDVPRREFYRPNGGGNWNNSANWSGDEVPETGDDVHVRDNRPGTSGDLPTANLTANGDAANLTVAEGANVDTENFRLYVVGTITVTDTDSDLFIRDGGEAEAMTITVSNDAEIRPAPGSLIDVEQLNVGQGSLLIGAGEVNVQTELENNGTITASDGTMTLTTSNTGGVFNLDGFFSSGGGSPIGIFTEPGKVNATGGDIVVDGVLTDGFNGTMTIWSARTITFQNDWELSSVSLSTVSAGFLNLTEGTVTGSGKMTAKGVINVSPDTGTSISYINSPVDFSSTVSVNVESGAELEVNGAATVEGGTYNIDDNGLLDFDGMLSIGSATFNDVGTAGTADVRFDGVTTYTGGTIDTTVPLLQNADATVNGATVINGTIVNLDGAGSTMVTLNDALTINADKLDSFSSEFDGTVNINNPGHLTVNTTAGSWTMAGTMNLDQNGQPNMYLVRGDDINMTGQVTVTGATAMSAVADISGTVTLGDADDLLQLGGGGNTLSDGEIVGPGRLATVSQALTGHGTISADIEFGGFNSNLLADGGTLSVSGEILDVDDIGTASSTGTLNMVNAWNTGVADELRLNGGVVTGGGITNDGTTIGHGTITSSSFANNSTLTADGGTLIVDTGSYPDLDGTTETGVVNALQGSVEVLTSHVSSFGFDGTLNVGTGHAFRSDARGLANSGVVNLTNGTVSVAALRHQDQLNVFSGGTSRLESPTIDFESGSTSAIDDDLEIVGDTDIFAGAVLSGSGQLVVPDGSLLNLLDGATVDIEVQNNGQMSVGSSPGSATVDALTQTGSGQLGIELGGTVPGTGYDQLDVVNSATLAGTLDVSLIDGFYPTQGDEFSVLTAGMRNGEFDAIDGIQVAADLTLAPLYDYEDLIGLILIAALPGDANFDGLVDVADLGILGANFNATDMQWDTGDFNLDGTTDVVDLGILGANWSSGGGLSDAQRLRAAGLNALVPEPATLCLLAMSVLMVGYRRR